MTRLRRHALGYLTRWLLAFALALSGMLPGHGASVAAGPGQDGLIVICSPDGSHLIDPATGEPAPGGRSSAHQGCVLCCCLAGAGLRPESGPAATRLTWRRAIETKPARDATVSRDDPSWRNAVPRAPPPRSPA